MFKIEIETGDIIFPDGYRLPVPYEDENNRYQEYAAWIHAGNEPEYV